MLKLVKLKKTAFFRLFSRKIDIVEKDLKKGFNTGDISPSHARILVLVALIVFAGYIIFIQQYYNNNFVAKFNPTEQRSPEEIRREIFKKELMAMVKGHPIEAMVPYIAEKDRETAAYMIGIAKKESNWGKRKPILDGEDCYNYWGFRAKRERMGSGGHTCFESPREAVSVVAKRINQIIERNDVESAKDMIVWKCGSNCGVTGGQAAADKWISDVDMYAEKVLN